MGPEAVERTGKRVQSSRKGKRNEVGKGSRRNKMIRAGTESRAQGGVAEAGLSCFLLSPSLFNHPFLQDTQGVRGEGPRGGMGAERWTEGNPPNPPQG